MAKGEESFESLYALLEEKSRKLEQGNLPLEESLKLYEEGATLVERLREILEGAELRIRTLQSHLEQDIPELREAEAEYEYDDE